MEESVARKSMSVPPVILNTMKTIPSFILIALIAAFPISALAQMETLMHNDVRHTGFGGPSTSLTWIDGEPGVMVGGGGAWVINGNFALGGAAYGIATAHHAAERVDGLRQTLEGGYGGITMEVITRPEKLVHFSGGVLVGAGGLTLMTGPRTDTNRDVTSETAFFVARPDAGVTLNIARFMQARLSGAYRFVVGSDLPGYSDTNLSGAEFGLGLRFGKF